jgi:hypothetical protein
MEQVSWPQIIDSYMPLATKGKYPNTVENLAGSTKIIMYKKIRIFEKLFMCTLTSKKSHFNNFLISMLESYIYIYNIQHQSAKPIKLLLPMVSLDLAQTHTYRY